jgi:hypothetical protein
MPPDGAGRHHLDLHSTRFSTRLASGHRGAQPRAPASRKPRTRARRARRPRRSPVTVARWSGSVKQFMAAARAFGRPPVRSSGAPLMMLSNAGRAGPLDSMSKECGYQLEPDPVAMAARYGANTSVSRLAQAACVFALRRTGGGYGPHRDEAELVDET